LVNYGVVEGVRSSVIPVSPNVDGAASAAVPVTIPLRAQWAVAGLVEDGNLTVDVDRDRADEVDVLGADR
jgi:hypothetical protein